MLFRNFYRCVLRAVDHGEEHQGKQKICHSGGYGPAGVCNTAPDVGERHMEIWNDAHGPPPESIASTCSIIRLTSN